MSEIFNSIMNGLTEAVEDAQSGQKSLRRQMVSIIPVKEYSAKEVRSIRQSTGMSQKLFAGYMGVSIKTVEAWESGRNHPDGAACRLLALTKADPAFPCKSGIVSI